MNVETSNNPAATASRHRIVLVDDVAEIRFLVRSRLAMFHDVEVVGEASNGREAVDLVRILAPELVVLDLEMPVMTGLEALPLMRALEPTMKVVLYTAAPEAALDLPPETAPDAIVDKGQPLEGLVTQLRSLLARGQFDVLRLHLGTIPLAPSVSAFDSWVALNIRILERLAAEGDRERGDTYPTRADLAALIGLCAHLGQALQAAAREGRDEVDLVVHTFRSTAQDARRALAGLEEQGMEQFFALWGVTLPTSATLVLDTMWRRLLSSLDEGTDYF